MFRLLSLFKVGERPLKRFLNVLFHNLTHRMKLGPNLDPKALNVHQLKGAVRPSVFVLLRLMTNSCFVACPTGRSAGSSVDLSPSPIC